jgi:hypothetical protein
VLSEALSGDAAEGGRLRLGCPLSANSGHENVITFYRRTC